MPESIKYQLASVYPQGETPFIIGIFALLAFIIVWMLLQQRAQAKQAGKLEEAKKEAEKILRQAQEEAELLRKNTKLESEVILKEAKVRAKEEVIAAKEEFENSCTHRKNELQKAELRLENKEENLDKKIQQADKRLEELEERDLRLRQDREQLQRRQNELDEKIQRQTKELERVANLSQEEAKDILLRRLEDSLVSERGSMIRRFQEEGRQRLLQESQEIMLTAMQRYAGDVAYERTTSTIPLPSEDMKGRIIGREGRNIRSIEAATGCNILIDDTPEAVVVSCFDPVRKEIGRIAMERLVADGRIHPTRIEEIVSKVSKEVDNEIQKAGQEAVEKLGLTRIRPNIVSLLGSLKYRYSYSQNVLMHSIEVASLMGIIAAQLGLDERKARRAGLLHDIGKAVNHEVEGSHAIIGADLLKRAGEDEEVVNAVAAHHEEVDKTSLLGILVNICDTLSAGRPGARSETTELYLKRLEQLEGIGNSFDGVETCYAIQAGRELRVIVQPEKIDEDAAAVLARDMAERIEKEMRYPGTIKVSVIRETRSVEVAK
ncbi:MAG: ribonuclease Y [Oligosphaeraceae bacterium]|nr:ribonuclease Y [Oligosphaeraceae bacterium]